MKKIIYLGMENKPYEIYETAHVENSKVVYQNENNNGKKVLLKATKTGKLYPVSILDRGYSGHHFELVEA